MNLAANVTASPERQSVRLEATGSIQITDKLLELLQALKSAATHFDTGNEHGFRSTCLDFSEEFFSANPEQSCRPAHLKDLFDYARSNLASQAMPSEISPELTARRHELFRRLRHEPQPRNEYIQWVHNAACLYEATAEKQAAGKNIG